MKNLKTILLTALILVALPASTMTLWEYYGGNLPSVEDRAPRYNEFFDDEYKGTAEQNTRFLNALTINENGVDNQNPLILGATLPQGVAVFQTSLLSAITSSASTMTLVANSVRGGSTLSGFNCFTVDEGSSIAEYICGTVSGTTVSSLTRGIDPLTGTTTNALLQFAHRRGAEVKVTDFPVIQIMRNQLNGTESIPNVLFYTSEVTISSTTQLTTKKYVDGVAVAGASNADESTKGIIELATTAEAGAGTSAGSTGARLVIPTSMCSSVSSANILCVITNSSGKISPQFISTTTADNYIWGGTTMFTASSTHTATTSISASNTLSNALILNGRPFAFPSNVGASSTALLTNGSGTLTWNTVAQGASAKFLGQTAGVTRTDTTTPATSTPINIPAGTLGVDGGMRLTFRIGMSDTAGSDNSDGIIRFALGGMQYCEFSFADIANGGSGMGELNIFANGNASVYMFGQVMTPGASGSSQPQNTSCETTVATSTVTDNLTLTATVRLTDQHGSDTESLNISNIYTMFLGRQN